MLADAGVEYVDLGAEWAAKAESLYWEALEEASPEFIGEDPAPARVGKATAAAAAMVIAPAATACRVPGRAGAGKP